jgi:hypothetical protein
MKMTTNDHHGGEGGSGWSRPRTRRLACISLALITSAGLGAVVGSSWASTATKPPAAVVPDIGSELQCTSTQPGPRVVLLAFQVSNADCTKSPMLVSARTITG